LHKSFALQSSKPSASAGVNADPDALLAIWKNVANVLDLSTQQLADAAMLLEIHA
jgi:hypothetical protein